MKLLALAVALLFLAACGGAAESVPAAPDPSCQVFIESADTAELLAESCPAGDSILEICAAPMVAPAGCSPSLRAHSDAVAQWCCPPACGGEVNVVGCVGVSGLR